MVCKRIGEVLSGDIEWSFSLLINAESNYLGSVKVMKCLVSIKEIIIFSGRIYRLIKVTICNFFFYCCEKDGWHLFFSLTR
jgi:hypothetical protein